MPDTHVTTIDPEPDSVGHWSWSCTTEGCDQEGSGYDIAADVVAAASAHGLLAASSPLPVDPETCLSCDGEGCEDCDSGEVTGAPSYRVQRS